MKKTIAIPVAMASSWSQNSEKPTATPAKPSESTAWSWSESNATEQGNATAVAPAQEKKRLNELKIMQQVDLLIENLLQILLVVMNLLNQNLLLI